MKLTNTHVISLLKEDFSPKEITDWIHHKQQATLRDEFAMISLQFAYHDYLKNAEYTGYLTDWRSAVAKDAYKIADAMLAEKNK